MAVPVIYEQQSPPPEPPAAPPAPRKRQAKPMPKAFKGASSYAEKRLAEALRERGEYMGRVAALNAEIPSLVSVIRALGGNPNISNGSMVAYPQMEMPYHAPYQPQMPAPAMAPPSDPGIDLALFQANAGPLPGLAPAVANIPLETNRSVGGAIDLGYTPRDEDEGSGLPKMGGGWQ